MQLRIARGRIIISTRPGRFRSYGVPRWTTVVPLAAILFLLILLHGQTTAPYLASGLRDRDIAMAARAIPAFARTAGVAAQNALFAAHPPEQSALPTLHVVVPRNTLDDIEQALVCGDPQLRHDAGGNKPYFRACFVDEHGVEHKSKICIRGTMAWHHSMDKPSLRIRISKSQVTQRQRYVELSRPEDALAMKNWLPLSVAPELGLMTCQPDHVRLFINRKYFGVYERSMRQGEPMALANHRMPGTFYKGDNGVDLWDRVNGWRMTGEVAPGDIRAFNRFLQLVQDLQDAPRASALNELQHVLDCERYARWAALMTVTGSLHTDEIHNQSFFFCSNQGLIEPVPWDPNSFGIHAVPTVPPDAIKHPIMTAVTRDPRWVHRRNQWIKTLIDTSCSTEAFEQVLSAQLARLNPDLKADRFLGQVVRTHATDQLVPISVAAIDRERAELTDWIRTREVFLRTYLDNARVIIRPGQPGATRVAVCGNVAVRVQHAGQEQILYPGLSESLTTHVGRPWEGAVETPCATPAPLVYTINGDPDDLQFTNAITGATVQPTRENLPATATRSIHPSQLATLDKTPIRLGPGIVDIDEDIITNPGQPLTVVAGTTLHLGPGAGIYCQGPTEFRGTREQPIEILPADAKHPFACLAITGAATAGSVLQHLEIAGGSIGQLHHQRFKGMLNVYNCPRVRMSDCRIGRNLIGDDAVNLAESRVVVSDCKWRDARADALDLDMVAGTIRNCRWENSGNDALDLMNCRVHVRGCSMRGSGDKGVSVGEDTQLLADRLHIRDCSIGVECKDASRALLRNCELVDNRTGAHAYQKKWFFSRGGSAAFVNCDIRGGNTQLSAEQRSSFLLVNTRLNSSERPRRVSTARQLPESWADLVEMNQ